MLPFTYLIGWSQQRRFYYGVRYAKGCQPTDLWSTYFTSSKRVKSFRSKHGEPDVIMIRRTFQTVEEARNWELKVLKRVKAVLREDFLNMHDHPTPLTTGKTIPKLSAAKKGKPFSDAHRAALQEAAKRRAASATGKAQLSMNGSKSMGRKHSLETKNAITEGLKRFHAPDLAA